MQERPRVWSAFLLLLYPLLHELKKVMLGFKALSSAVTLRWVLRFSKWATRIGPLAIFLVCFAEFLSSNCINRKEDYKLYRGMCNVYCVQYGCTKDIS